MTVEKVTWATGTLVSGNTWEVTFYGGGQVKLELFPQEGAQAVLLTTDEWAQVVEASNLQARR